MKRHSLHLIAWIVLLAVSRHASAELSPWINEFHYDNTGTDNNEFVEVAVPLSITDLSTLRLTLYNGGDGKPYGTSHLLSSFTAGETHGSFTLYSKPLSGLQNGAPDGLSLDLQGAVVHFIGYEGGFVASSGPAAGLLAMDVGRTEGDLTPPGGSVGLVGTGGEGGGGDFLWESLGEATPGGANLGQFIVPEPRASVLVAVFGMAGWLYHRSRSRPGQGPHGRRDRR